MTVDKIQKRISSLISHFTFEHQGVDCGIDPISPTQFDVWCGDSFITLDSIDKVMDTPFFNGKPLKDITREITIVDQ